MTANRNQAPLPDLRIVLADSLYAHEEHDSQRLLPLVERFKQETYIINPPVVAPMGANRFVILDGANRCHAFQMLNYPHMLVQVAAYESGYVELETWNHVISHWDAQAFLNSLLALPDIDVHDGQVAHAIAHIILADQRVFALVSPVDNIHERNTVLRKIVAIYQQNAMLNRTTTAEPSDVWMLYPDAIALVVFQRYDPADILAAAKYQAYLPPGVSRHILHGRAVRVNYSIDLLRDTETSLLAKNEQLARWLQEKMSRRQVRYYAEATYQFDE